MPLERGGIRGTRYKNMDSTNMNQMGSPTATY